MARTRSNTDQFVLAQLEGSPTPMTAYELLGALRDEGIQSPPVVYRALDRLEKAGRIHRLEGLNAYFACHGHHNGATKPIFAVCTECRRVEEWSGEAADTAFREMAKTMGFTIEGRTIEVRGKCSRCAGLSAPDGGAACCGHAVRLAGHGAA
ncbi:MAG: Fur family transcriptional regulator [Ancalomicrobiaceae bacterium]|nr:Fur family transcriptional regulator [Ancalomicrobiaceae bacterium]